MILKHVMRYESASMDCLASRPDEAVSVCALAGLFLALPSPGDPACSWSLEESRSWSLEGHARNQAKDELTLGQLVSLSYFASFRHYL